MCWCKKVVFSPSFSCSAWSSSRASSQITPTLKPHREIVTLHCCPECFAQQVPQNNSWLSRGPAPMSESLLLESYSAILAGLLVLFLLKQAKRMHSAATLAELPPSTGVWLLQLAVAIGLLQGAILRRPQLQCPIPSPRPSFNHLLGRRHVTILDHPCPRSCLSLCHSLCQSPCRPCLCPLSILFLLENWACLRLLCLYLCPSGRTCHLLCWRN